jgi:uncharacterized protein
MGALSAVAGLGAVAWYAQRRTRTVGGLQPGAILYVTGNGQYARRSEDPSVSAAEHALVGARADGSDARRISTPFGGHSVLKHPRAPLSFLAVEKWGPEACLVDWAANAVVKRIPARPGNNFYGHGTFTLSGDALLMTESDAETGRGVLTVRDPDSYAILGALDVKGYGPHDCALTADGKCVVVPVTGRNMSWGRAGNVIRKAVGDSFVAVIELASGRLVEKMPNPAPELSLTHIFRSTVAPTKFFIGTTTANQSPTERAGIAALTLGGSITMLRGPAEVHTRFVAEVLSLAEHPDTGLLGATCPIGNIVTFWDVATGEFRGKLEHPFANGICASADGKGFVLSSGKDGGMWFVSASAPTFAAEVISTRVGNGSHMCRAAVS